VEPHAGALQSLCNLGGQLSLVACGWNPTDRRAQNVIELKRVLPADAGYGVHLGVAEGARRKYNAFLTAFKSSTPKLHMTDRTL